MLAEAKEAGGGLWTYPSRLRFHGYGERLCIFNRPAAEALREAGEVQGKRFLSDHVLSPALLDQDRI